MRFLYTFVILCLVGGWVQAQPPTATPHPNALPVGIYQFEDLSSPEMELEGASWVITSQNGQDGLEGSTSTDTLTFWVDSMADYLMIYRYVGRANPGEWAICVELVCDTVWDDDGGGINAVAIELYETNSEVVITKTNDRASFFDFMQIILDPNAIQAVSGTSSSYPTATPEPYYIYDTITGVSGTVATRFDMVVTAGDVAISNALIFLFFSLWAIFLILVIGKD